MNWLIAILDFIFVHWGSLASLIGAVLTVMFSWGAKTAAESANASAQQTREKLQYIDVLSELNRLDGRIDDLLYRLESGSWEIVSERSTDLRVSLASILALDSVKFDETLQERLLLAVNQFKNISNGARRAGSSEKTAPDIDRYHRIVADQKETIALAIVATKSAMGESNAF